MFNLFRYICHLSVLHVEKNDVSGQPMPAESRPFGHGFRWLIRSDSQATFTNYTEDFKGTLDYIWPLGSPWSLKKGSGFLQCGAPQL